jgi:hypothetical protein
VSAKKIEEQRYKDSDVREIENDALECRYVS